MRQNLENLNPFHGVVSGGKATCEIHVPEPMRCHKIELIFESDNSGTVERRTKAVMLTQVDYVEIFINNKPQRKMTVAEIFEDLEMRGFTIEDGKIPLVFSRDERQLGVERDATALFLGVGDSVRVSVKLLTCTTPTLKAHLRVEPFDDKDNYGQLQKILKNRTRQVIESVRSDVVTVSATGKLNFSLTSQGRDLSCVKLRTANADYITIYRGVDKKWEGTPADFDEWMKEQGYTPQSGVIHFFPEAYGGGRLYDWYQYRGKQLRFELNMTSATSFQADIYEVGDAVR